MFSLVLSASRSSQGFIWKSLTHISQPLKPQCVRVSRGWRTWVDALLLLRTTQPLYLLLNDNSWHDGEGDDDDDDSNHNNRGVALLLIDNSCHLFLGVTTCPGASHKSWPGWPQAYWPQALLPIQQQVWVLVVKEIITTWCGVCNSYGKDFCLFW